MADDSQLDRKYFVDNTRYNCPYCNRRHVVYQLESARDFDWNDDKTCRVIFARCESCGKASMHLTFDDIMDPLRYGYSFKASNDIDTHIFFSQPTSFFVLDARIPAVIRNLVTEAESCLKMNLLTGASACMRKAIYELLVKEGFPPGGKDSYEDRIKKLKAKYPQIDTEYFDVLAAIQRMTSDHVHEQSWPAWDSANIRLIMETLKAILYELYVLPEEKKEKLGLIKRLRQKVKGEPAPSEEEAEPAEEAPAPEVEEQSE